MKKLYYILSVFLVVCAFAVAQAASTGIVDQGNKGDGLTTSTPSGTTQTIDFNNGTFQGINLSSATGTVTVTFSNPTAGARYRIEVTQGSGSRNITWPAAVKWPGGTTPTVTTTSGKIDVFYFDYDGTNYLGRSSQNY